MSHASAQLRALVNPPRSSEMFSLVRVVRQVKPSPLTACLDCGGTLESGNVPGFLCPICSSRWRSRWIPCPWWERLVMRLLPNRYRWQRYRVERGQ